MGSLPLDRHGLRIHRERNRATHALTLLTCLLCLAGLVITMLHTREWSQLQAQQLQSKPTAIQLVMLDTPGTLSSTTPLPTPSPALTNTDRQAASSKAGGAGGEVANPGQTGLATDLGGQAAASANTMLMATSTSALQGGLTSGSFSVTPVQADHVQRSSASGASLLTTQSPDASWSLPELYLSEQHVRSASDRHDPHGAHAGSHQQARQATATTSNSFSGQSQSQRKGALDAPTATSHEGQRQPRALSSAVLAADTPSRTRQAGATRGATMGQQSAGQGAHAISLAHASSHTSRSPSRLSGASVGARAAQAEGTPGKDGHSGPSHDPQGHGLDESMDDLRESLGWGALDRSQLAARQAHQATTSLAGASSPTRTLSAVKIVDDVVDTPLASYLDQVDTTVWAAWMQYDLAPHERALGIQGDTTVDFIIERDGRVVDVVIRSESGHHGLDAMAHSAVPRRLPRFPRSFHSERILHRVIFHYRNPLTSPR